MTEEKYDIEVKRETTPATVLDLAIEKGASLEQLEKFMDLKIKWEEREAKKAYVLAVAKFKADPPDIYKDKFNKQFGSKYSSIDALVNPTIPYLSKQGLSHSWDYGMTEAGWPTVTCILSHSCGYSQEVTMSAPPDTSGGNSKNLIQQIKSTQTYLKIATFEAVTGLVSREGNLDDDGNASGESVVKYITKEQANQLKKERELRQVDGKKFLAHFEIENLEDLPAKKFNEAMNIMKAKPIPREEREKSR